MKRLHGNFRSGQLYLGLQLPESWQRGLARIPSNRIVEKLYRLYRERASPVKQASPVNRASPLHVIGPSIEKRFFFRSTPETNFKNEIYCIGAFHRTRIFVIMKTS